MTRKPTQSGLCKKQKWKQKQQQKTRERMGLCNWLIPVLLRGLIHCSHDVTKDPGTPSPYPAHHIAAFFRLHRMELSNSRLIAPTGKTPEAIPYISHYIIQQKIVSLGELSGRERELLFTRSSSKHLFTSHWLWLGHMPISELITVTREMQVPTGLSWGWDHSKATL